MDRRSLRDTEWTVAFPVRACLVTLLTCLMATAPAFTQASHTNRGYSATFATSGQSMWEAGTAPLTGFSSTTRILDVGWNVGDTTGDIRSFDTFLFGVQSFGGEIGAFSRGNFGLYQSYSDVSSGDVSVTYPVQVTLGIPDPNTFRDGQEITIPSSWALAPGASISSVQPHGSMALTGSAALAAGAHTRVCLFGCLHFPLFPSVDFGESDIPILAMGVDANGNGFGEFFGLPRQTLPHTISFLESQITNMSGRIGLPNVNPATTINSDRSLRAFGRDTFFHVSFDVDGLISGKIPLGFETPNFHGARLKYETVDLAAVLRMFQDQTLTFTPTIKATLTFPQAVQWTERDGDGGTVASGNSAVITFTVGNTLAFTYPPGLKDPITVSPVFSIRNTFTTATSTHFRESLELTIGVFELEVPSVELFPEITADACHFATVTLDVAGIIPDESCPVTTPAVHSPVISINLGPLHQQTLFGLGQDLTLFPGALGDPDGSWELQGFNAAPGASFVLDPENPIIAVTTTIASALATGTGPAGTLTQMIGVSNAGDVPLSAAQIADALAAMVAGGGGFTVNTISSLELSENQAFNGTADQNTLTRADVLAVGGAGTVMVNLGVQPGNVFTALLEADGTSPIGTTVRANAAASFGVFAFDVRPSLQSSPSDGVLPVIVFGAPGMDPGTIDVATARLEGVAPLRSEVVFNGTFNDLTLKFDRQAILAAIQARLAAPAAVAAVGTVGEQPRMPEAVLPDGARVARAVLGDAGALTASERHAADRNENGTLDVGDLRAILYGAASEPTLVLAMAPPAGGGGGGPGANDRITLTLVLTGSLTSGTPFMGEDPITIKFNGSGL